MFPGTKKVHVTLSLGSSSKGGMVQCVEVCHLGESNAGIRHYSDIQCCQRRAFSMVRKIETDFRLLLSEEVGYECEYKLIQLFSDKHVQR